MTQRPTTNPLTMSNLIWPVKSLHDENFAFIRGQKSKSTLDKTERDVKRFHIWLKAMQDEPRNKETIEPPTLSTYFFAYIRALKKPDGSEYEPDTITSVMGSFDRYLRENFSLDSAQFKSTKDMVEAERHLLKASGIGNKPNKVDPLTDEEIEKLWQDGGFGIKEPNELSAATWYLLALNFGLRGCHECRQLKLGEIQTKEDTDGHHAFGVKYF